MKLYSVIILISFTFSSSLFPCPFLSPSLFLYFLLPHSLLLLSHTHSLTLLSPFLPHSLSPSPSSLHFYLPLLSPLLFPPPLSTPISPSSLHFYLPLLSPLLSPPPLSTSPSPSSLHFYLLEILRRLALHGLVHCDFNEFNLMVDQEGQVTLIDFPQVCTAQHVLTLCGTVRLCV